MGGERDASQEGAEERVYEVGEQRPMETDPTRYYQPGRLQVGIGRDGLPLIQGDPPDGPEPGLADDNLVCTEAPGRPQCVHLRGIVTGAPGVARGFGQLYQIRRFCPKLGTTTEMMDLEGLDVYACLSREPFDPASFKKWEEIEARQKQASRDAAETSGELDF